MANDHHLADMHTYAIGLAFQDVERILYIYCISVCGGKNAYNAAAQDRGVPQMILLDNVRQVVPSFS